MLPSPIFSGTHNTTADAPSAANALNIHVEVMQSSGRAPPVQRLMYTGRNTLMGVIHADRVAMCCLGTPRSSSLSVVSVSAAENAIARVTRIADSLSTAGSLAMATACRYASATESPGASSGRSFLRNTKPALPRNTNPQKEMNPPSPTLPYAFSTRNPVKEMKKPAVCPTELHVLASPTLRRDSMVSAHPSTAMSCDASSA
mmetsp:Transcript_25026/g.62557  ORF Transcript_25026/g.62557 Transcript_25026/m.62557 type:complete len:202 (+) Transcript_25026:740-1345(+)